MTVVMTKDSEELLESETQKQHILLLLLLLPSREHSLMLFFFSLSFLRRREREERTITTAMSGGLWGTGAIEGVVEPTTTLSMECPFSTLSKKSKFVAKGYVRAECCDCGYIVYLGHRCAILHKREEDKPPEPEDHEGVSDSIPIPGEAPPTTSYWTGGPPTLATTTGDDDSSTFGRQYTTYDSSFDSQERD